MPKENTHISFAKKIYSSNEESLKIISKYTNYYYLGSILPDTFYYSKNIKIKILSNILHGENGEPTNKIIFDLLDKAKESKNEKLLVFVFGIITHCYLDMTFHPVIFYMTGNFYNKDELKRQIASYKHRRMEVWLDEKINSKFYFKNLINKEIFNDTKLLTILSDKFNVLIPDIKDSFINQYRRNILFYKKYLLIILYFLNKIHIINNEPKIALFYGHLPNDDLFANEFEYKDLFTGKALKTNINELWEKAEIRTNSALTSAFRYYLDEIQRAEAEVNIDGESLDTGSKEFGVKEIKFTK